MAQHALIDAYLESLSESLSHRRDALDLRDEVADHLYLSVELSTAEGIDGASAERMTLDRFGDPHLVAALLAAVPQKGIDMISTLSRAAGPLALIAALAWIAVILAGPTGLIALLDRTWSTDEYMVSTVPTGLAVLATGLAVLALMVRATPRIDALAGIVIVSMAIALVLAVLIAWSYLAWAPYLAVGLAVGIARTERARETRGIVSVLLIAVVPPLLVVGSMLSILGLSGEAQAGWTSLNITQAEFAIFAITSAVWVLLAAGLAIVGVRLLAERQSVEPTHLPSALA